MTSREQDTTGGLPRPNDMGDSGRREDTVLADDEVGDAVPRCDLDDLLDALGGVETPVSTDDESRTLRARGGDPFEDGLDEVLRVVLLLEDYDSVQREEGEISDAELGGRHGMGWAGNGNGGGGYRLV